MFGSRSALLPSKLINFRYNCAHEDIVLSQTKKRPVRPVTFLLLRASDQVRPEGRAGLTRVQSAPRTAVSEGGGGAWGHTVSRVKDARTHIAFCVRGAGVRRLTLSSTYVRTELRAWNRTWVVR